MELGLDLPREGELAAGRAIMAALIGEGISTIDTIMGVHERNPLHVLVYREDQKVTGVLAFLLLRPAGLLSIVTDRFDGVAPDLDLIAGPDETPLAGYGWGLAAKTRKAAAAVLVGMDKIRNEIYPVIPFFARVATPDGRRVACGRLRYVPFPRSSNGLLWNPPIVPETESAQ